ncbi:fimbrial outer membrane usher protein [Salmonella enterica subsp. enterica serovar Gaminara]|nr:fimbrial outer membrane usher protein [Salmonella enterica subsp. enterica serovar Gaminara]
MRKRQHRGFYLSRCAVCIALGSTFAHVAWARDYFNPAFIEHHGQANRTSVDLSTFDNDKSQLPGTYYVTIIINKTEIGARNVDFQLTTLSDGQQALQGCLRLQELKDNGVKTDLFPTLESEKSCVDLSAIPGASQQFDFQQQALSISIPQLYIANNARGYVPPEKWQEGITALMLNYSFSGYKEYGSSEDSDDAESKYLALQPGFNLGPWRFRNYSNWSANNGESGSWNSVYNYLQRDIIALKSQFTAGDSNTPSDVFDSVPFRGLQLTSDDQMQPNSQRGYAPTIRGIARSNAQVIVRQNGYIAYQTAVSPGEFEINDMFPTGSNGDYDVTVKEADGSEQHFIVPYSSLPILQRTGRAKYSVTVGKYRDYDNHTLDDFGQATLLYGLPWGITLYGGSQIAGDKYQSVAFGVGQNMQMLGAISLDGIWSHAKFDDGRKEAGQSWRVRYSKGVVSTGTTFSLAGYRYASENYNSLSEVINPDDDFYDNYGKRHNRFEASVNQQISDTLGSLTLSWVKEDYWHSAQQMESLSANYNNSWGPVSYTLSYSYNKNTYQYRSDNDDDDNDDDRYNQNDRLFTLSLHVPFTVFDSRLYASYMLNTRKHDATVNSTPLSGTALRDRNLNWSLQQSHSTQDGDSGGVNASYKGTYANLNAGYNQSPDSQQVSYGISGGILAQKGTHSETRYYGHMDYYVLVTGKLEIGTEAYIAGKLGEYIPVPFSSISNNDASAGGCGDAEMKSMTAGNKGTVRIYITHPLVGEISIPQTTIMNLYLSKTPGSSGDNIPPSIPPIAHVTMSGTITVPQSCSINAGQVIEVRLPDIEGKDIRHLGDSPQNSHVTTQVNFTCSNVADGTNLSMSLNGETDPHNPEYLKTDNENLGIRISDKYDKTIVPGGSAELPIEDYADGRGSTEFTAAPVNTTGHVPHTGEYQATATLEIQIR